MKALLPVLALALTLYALIDCARTSDEDMPARMPKMMWIILIVMVAVVGPVAWIIVSRVKAAEERGGYVEPTVWSSQEGTSFRRPQRPRPAAPDDDPEFLRRLDEDLRRQRHDADSGSQGATTQDHQGGSQGSSEDESNPPGGEGDQGEDTRGHER
ncbi:MAG: PLDc_N domain-containing protein [Actinomyces urogenitalis]|uniref:PLD nuclease N-terminal domain-containing protein n=1 Tax=Actinomyces urogenitalis TaxID=103621 RepID=UPI00242E3506|nr:PLD nuclease N-terminal domain-containing protein [Actinomyces urogenitalis]MBS5976569.1 PLDc_N domain-containing protein [Actinomyces urogenitalis]